MSRRGAFITLTATLVIVFGLLALTQLTGTTPRLGLDLQGGFSVVLEAPAGTDPDVLDQAVEIMRRRIEALGDVQEPEISVVGDRTVEVQLPGVTDRERALAAVGTTGQLEFRPVLAVSPIPGLSPVFLNVEVPDDGSTTTTTTVAGATTTAATTTSVAGTTSTTEAGGTTTTTTAPPVDPWEGVILPEGVTRCDIVDQPGCLDPVSGLTRVTVPGLEAFLATDFATGGGIAYHTGPARVLGSDLKGAQAQFQGSATGAITGQWIVVLDFTEEGGAKFAAVTAELAGFAPGDPRRQFAIVLDGTVQSAPSVANDVSPETGISGGSAVITLGGSDDQESAASNLSVVLRYGSLPVAFEQSSVESISATLGSESLRAGLIAGLGGLLLVAVAMILYYRALGLINVIGLSVFGSLMMVIFSALGAWQGVTLTLAGVAGVIVAVGITADSYVVYYERIKEEVHGGRSLRSAVDHAFTRAIRTILTADTVSFAGAVLLFFLAIGSVKGFALALLIATMCDLFVAVFFTRPAVALLAQTRLGDGGRFSIRGATGLPTEGKQ
ncbi:MAG: protein translocase subunit SecD [Actinomycetota bacterium]